MNDLIRRALEEDVGPGDITTNLCIDEQARALGRFIAREEMVVAGVELLAELFEHVDVCVPSEWP